MSQRCLCLPSCLSLCLHLLFTCFPLSPIPSVMCVLPSHHVLCICCLFISMSHFQFLFPYCHVKCVCLGLRVSCFTLTLCSVCSVCFLLTCYYVYSSQLCCPCASFSLVTLLCSPVCMNCHAFIVKSSVMFMPCYQGFMLPGIYEFSPGFMFTFLFPQFRFLFSVVLVCLALCFILFIKHNKCLTFS